MAGGGGGGGGGDRSGGFGSVAAGLLMVIDPRLGMVGLSVVASAKLHRGFYNKTSHHIKPWLSGAPSPMHCLR